MNEDLCTCNHADGWQCTDGVPAGTNRRGPCACPCHRRKPAQMERPTALLSTFPGDVPGVLRRGSPFITMDGRRRGVVGEDPRGCNAVVVFIEPGPDDEDEPGELRVPLLSRLDLDLTDPTGRSHLAAWCRARLTQFPDDASWAAIAAAETYRDMTPTEIDTLARLGLRLAGRNP